MKLENLIIKLNTSYDIEDIDEVEANGTSKAEAIGIVNDMCWEEINDQIEEVLDDVKTHTVMRLQNVNFILMKFQNYALTQKSMKLNTLLQKKLKKNSLKT